MIEINGKEYELVYDINVMCKMAAVGLDVMGDGLERIVESLPNLRKAFYYGLLHNNKKLTEVQAGNLMTKYFQEGNQISDLMEQVIKELKFGLGIVDDQEEEEVKETEGKQSPLDK